MAYVRLQTELINDWSSFHRECKRALGFPSFYGANMNAWIDCMSDLREDSRMSAFLLEPDEVLELEVPEADALRRRVPDLLDALAECTAFVNQSFTDEGEAPALKLILS